MSASKGAIPKVSKPTKKHKEENEYFIMNALLVASLIPFIPLELQLESGIVTLPFIKDPPEGRLKPISEAMDKNIYEEILEAANRSSYADDDILPPRNEIPENEQIEYQRIRPSEFLQSQPKPRFGFVAYGSCFSDQRN